MAVKLHRCPFTFVKTEMDPCFVVQKALDEQGIAYEIVKEPYWPKSRRTTVIEKTGQKWLPAVELEDGTWYREESAEMAARIRAGRLFEQRASDAADS
jgi:hypothetical protein